MRSARLVDERDGDGARRAGRPCSVTERDGAAVATGRSLVRDGTDGSPCHERHL